MRQRTVIGHCGLASSLTRRLFYYTSFPFACFIPSLFLSHSRSLVCFLLVHQFHLHSFSSASIRSLRPFPQVMIDRILWYLNLGHITLRRVDSIKSSFAVLLKPSPKLGHHTTRINEYNISLFTWWRINIVLFGNKFPSTSLNIQNIWARSRKSHLSHY